MNLIALKKETILNTKQQNQKKKNDWKNFVLASDKRKKEDVSHSIDEIVYLNKD